MSKHKMVPMNTDPSGIHYSTYGIDYDGCEECLDAWPCEVSILEEENTALKARVEELERQQPRPIPTGWMYDCKDPVNLKRMRANLKRMGEKRS